MRDIQSLREELNSIDGARIEFLPDTPPHISWSAVSATGERVAHHGREPHIDIGPPAEGKAQPREAKWIFDRLDRDFGSGPGDSPQTRGVDALAWYASFHNLNDMWGIFIPESSLWYLAERWLGQYRTSKQRKLAMAFRVLYEHEAFHFAADLNVAQWEVMLRKACWAPYRARIRAQKSYCVLEEQLANAYMLRTLLPGLSESGQAELLKSVRAQPPGYCDAEEILEVAAFEDSLVELCKQHAGIPALASGVVLASRNLAIDRLFAASGPIDGTDCPVYLIRDAGRIGRASIDVGLFDRIPAIQESDVFTKQLVSSPQDIRSRWLKKKQQLAQAIPRHPEFERLKGVSPHTYSIRLNKGYRVHLRPEPSYELWTAIGVGPHTKMGHGH